MKTILCAGCSWTYGHGLQDYQTYPAKIQDHLDDCKVINAGLGGRDNQYSTYVVSRMIAEMQIDLVLFQITTFDRLTLGNDGYKNFIEDRVFDKKQKSIYNIKEKYTRLGSLDHQEHLTLTAGEYLNSKKSKIIKYLMEKSVYSNYTIDITITNLYNLKMHLEYLRIPMVLFSWVPLPQGVFDTTYGNNLTSRTYIDQPVLKYLETKTQNYFIDNGYHVSEKANALIAKNFLIPHCINMGVL
jgi:hypothetical protein